MLGINVSMDDVFINDLIAEIESGNPEDLFNMIFEGYVEKEFKSKWQKIMLYEDYEGERKILRQVKADIINHLLISTCCIDVLKHYESNNPSFIVQASDALENMKELKYLKRMDKKNQNGHLINKGEKDSFMFPFELKEPLAFPLYFDKYLAYYLIGMYKSDISKEKPAYIYRHCLLDEDPCNSKELLNFCANYIKLSLSNNSTILDDYLFEQEFNHILTLDIIESVNSIIKPGFDIPRELIEFTLSFLCLLPLYTRTSFINLFLSLGEDATPRPFSVDWAKECIDAIVNLSFISIPLMEQFYYHMLGRKREVEKNSPVLIRNNNTNKILKLLQELYAADSARTKALDSVFSSIDNSEYCRVQSYCSLLTSAFRKDVFDSICTVRNDSLFINISDSETDTQIAPIREKKFYTNNIFDSVYSILNGNLSAYIDEPFSTSIGEEKYLTRRIAASKKLGDLIANKIYNRL